MIEKYVYKPRIEELFYIVKKGKKIFVTAYFEYGNIICFDLKGDFVDNWTSGYFEYGPKKKLKKWGTIIQPRWERYTLNWKLYQRNLDPNDMRRDRIINECCISKETANERKNSTTNRQTYQSTNSWNVQEFISKVQKLGRKENNC